MATVFDIAGFVIEEQEATVDLQTATVDVTLSAFPEIDLVESVMPGSISVVEVQVPGLQGPPGLDNYYVGSTEPTEPTLNMIWFRTAS